MDPPIFCLSYFMAKNGKVNELMKALYHLIEPTLSEPDCLQYELARDIKNPNFLIMIEKFSSEKALAEHENKPYVKHFMDNEMSQLCKEVTWHEAAIINSFIQND